MPSPAFVLANGESIDTPKWHKQRRDELERLRQPYLERWDELQRYILPRLGRTFRARGQTSKPPSMDLVIDTTAPQSLGIAAAGMMATITSPARRWMKLTAREQEPGAGVPPAIEEWLQHAEDALFPFWDETNYYGMTEIENVESLLFGTSAGYGTQVTGANEHEFLWRAIPAGQYVIAEDAMGKVDTLYREYVMSVEQVVSRFGTRGADGRIDIEAPTGGEYVSGTFSARLQQMWREGRWDEPVILIQHFGRSPYTGQYLSGEPKWQELVFEAEADMDHVEGNFLSRTMFNVLPLAVSRWETNGVDPYGASPGMEALPDVKQLLEMEEKKAAALSLLINPPLQGPPDAVQNQRISSLPGDVNANDALSAGGAIVPLYEVKPDIPSFEASMEQVRSRIRRAFHADLFLAFMERPGLQPLNDYEAIQRKEEKLLGLGQVVYRKNREAIRPHVEISLDYLNATGRIDDPPDELGEYDIEYNNNIAVAQRTQGLTAINDVVDFIYAIAEKQTAIGQEATAADRIDVDRAVRGFAKRRGVDVNILRDEDEVEALEEERAQAKAQMADMAEAQQAAATAKDLATAEDLSNATQADQGPLATGGGPGALAPDVGAPV